MAESILVVDDEQEIADLVEVYLHNEGYTVHKFYNAKDALNCLDKTTMSLGIIRCYASRYGWLFALQADQTEVLFPDYHVDGKSGRYG